MLEILLSILPSAIWILYRCYSLLQTPVEKLVENLNIEIPHAPTICIDSVTELSVIIHWDIEIAGAEELIYIIFVNNKEVALVNTTSCKLNNLQINKLYQIFVVAVNVNTNYRSKSSPVYIETLVHDKPTTVSSAAFPYNSIKELPFLKGKKEIANKLKLAITRGSSSAISAGFGTGNSDSQGSLLNFPYSIEDELTALTPEQIKQIEDPNLLNNYLIKYQDDMSKFILEYEEFQASSHAEELEILKTLAIHRKEFEEESDLKLKLDNNIKDIEKTKDALTFTKSKIFTQLKSLVTTKDLHKSNLESLKSQLQKLQEKNKILNAKSNEEKVELATRISDLNSQVLKIKAQNVVIDNEIKELGLEKKKYDKLYLTLKPLMEVISKELNFTRDGTLKPNSQASLNEIYEIMPEWRSEIEEELDKTQKNEIEWKHVFKSEIRKYMSIKQSIEIARSNIDKNYQPSHAKLTEYLVSLEFGGYANVLPKTAGNSNNSTSSSNNTNASTNKNKHSKPEKIALPLSSLVPVSSAPGMLPSELLNTPPALLGSEGGGWHNFYGQVYSNDTTVNDVASDHQGMHPVEDPSISGMRISRVGTPLQQFRLDNLDAPGNMQALQASASTNDYNDYGNSYQYQPLSLATTNHVWNSLPSLATSTLLNDHYIGLNALGYDSSHQLAQPPAPPASTDFYTSLNQSNPSFNADTPPPLSVGGANLLRSTVFQQFKGLDLPQSSPPYINYTSPSPVPPGFMMSPSASANAATAVNGHHLPADSLADLLHSVSDSLSISGASEIKTLSPQLNHIPLNSLWSPLPYGHTRNVLNHSQSQIWRNGESGFGTALSDYNKRTTSTGSNPTMGTPLVSLGVPSHEKDSLFGSYTDEPESKVEY